MAGLTNCVRKMGKSLPKTDLAEIRRLRKSLLEDGASAAEATEQAIDILIDEARADIAKFKGSAQRATFIGSLNDPNIPETLPARDPLLQETITKEGRAELRRKLVNQAKQGATKPPDGSAPVAILMGGGGASGKGTLLRALIESGQIQKTAVIDPDDIKTSIPEFDQILKKGDGRAAQVVHEEGSALAKQAIKELIGERANIIIDKTFANSKKGVAQIEALKQAGYDVVMYGVTVDVDTAIERAVERFRNGGRSVDRDQLRADHNGYAKAFNEYVKKADAVFLVDNNGSGTTGKQIARKTEGDSLQILDPVLYSEFERKAQDEQAQSETAGTAEQVEQIRSRGDDRSAQSNQRPEGTREKEQAPDSGLVSGERLTPAPRGQRGFVVNPLSAWEEAMDARFNQVSEIMVRKLSKVGLARNVPQEFNLMLRRFRATQQKAARKAGEVAKKAAEVLTPEMREMLSDVIEGELKAGQIPPQEIQAMVAVMQEAIEQQTSELIDLGMLSQKTADRWRGKYLPRYYQKPQDPIPKSLHRRTLAIDGSHLRGRGKFEWVMKKELPHFQQLGWEIRDPDEITQQVLAGMKDTDRVLIWRDWTRSEREQMHEVRDAIYRFTRGYLEVTRDVALGRLFSAIAGSDFATPRQLRENQVQVPETVVPGTGGLKRYGRLAGMWVPKDVWADLQHVRDGNANGAIMSAYLRGLSLWKEGKTALNPVVHSNNVWSQWIQSDLAGIPFWDVAAYRRAFKEYRTKGPLYREAVDHGLFGTEFYAQEIRQTIPQLEGLADIEAIAAKKLNNWLDYMVRFSGVRAYRDGMGRLYQAEDQFFKLLIYMDERKKGGTPDEAINRAEFWIFNYADIPTAVRQGKRWVYPFLSYTYKAIPAWAYAWTVTPWRAAKWWALFAGANWAFFAALFGPDHEEKEKDERKVMPEFMKGSTPLLTPKNIRWPFDRSDNVATYLDLSRRMPLGDLFDITNQMGGLGIMQPLMPNSPLFTTSLMILANKDSFTGRDVTDPRLDTFEEKWKKRMRWLAFQALPNTPILPFSYSWDKVMQGVVSELGEPIDIGIASYTGKNFHGEEQSLARALLSTTVGFKIREFDVERERGFRLGDLRTDIKDIVRQIRTTRRDNRISEKRKDEIIEGLRTKLERAREARGDLR